MARKTYGKKNDWSINIFKLADFEYNGPGGEDWAVCALSKWYTLKNNLKFIFKSRLL